MIWFMFPQEPTRTADADCDSGRGKKSDGGKTVATEREHEKRKEGERVSMSFIRMSRGCN